MALPFCCRHANAIPITSNPILELFICVFLTLFFMN